MSAKEASPSSVGSPYDRFEARCTCQGEYPQGLDSSGASASRGEGRAYNTSRFNAHRKVLDAVRAEDTSAATLRYHDKVAVSIGIRRAMTRARSSGTTLAARVKSRMRISVHDVEIPEGVQKRLIKEFSHETGTSARAAPGCRCHCTDQPRSAATWAATPAKGQRSRVDSAAPCQRRTWGLARLADVATRTPPVQASATDLLSTCRPPCALALRIRLRCGKMLRRIPRPAMLTNRISAPSRARCDPGVASSG